MPRDDGGPAFRGALRELSSGYWHFWLSPEQWCQWPVGRAPRPEDAFGLDPERIAEMAAAMLKERAK